MPAAQAPLPVAPALEKLADIVVPEPASWLPQTWGWAALAAVALVLAAWEYTRWRRRREANRYRALALRELARLEAALDDDAARVRALAALPELLKRVALAAWPRAEVAPLSGAPWVAFLREHAGRGGLPEAAARLLDDLEYRPSEALARLGAEEAKACARAARAWIEGHRAPA